MNESRSIIVHFSPAGTTQRIAGLVASTLITTGQEVIEYNLISENQDEIIQSMKDQLRKGDCLWIGSPIYASHVVPQIKELAANLPDVEGVFAVPFVTYGCVTSGVGLYELAEDLENHGFSLIGAAKIISTHSMLYFCDNPLGENHPGPDDEKKICTLVNEVSNKMNTPDTKRYLDNSHLDYQSQKIKENAANWNISQLLKSMPPLNLDENKCEICGTCVEKCPADNITLLPLPTMGENCILCFNCIRFCNQDALTNDSFGVLEKAIRAKVIEYGEPMETKIFI